MPENKLTYEEHLQTCPQCQALDKDYVVNQSIQPISKTDCSNITDCNHCSEYEVCNIHSKSRAEEK